MVTNACGRAEIRRTRCARRSGSSSEKTSSSSRSGGRPSCSVRRSSSASLNERIAVRCWPRDANPARSRPVSSKAMSSRCGPISVAPFQTSLSAVSTSRRASASRGALTGLCRRVRHVAEGQRRRRRLVGGDLGMGPSEWIRQARQEREPIGHDPPAGVEERRVPEPQLVASRALLADRAEESVALLEGAPVRREGARVARASSRSRAGPGWHAAAPASRRSAASPRARTRRRGAVRRGSPRGGRVRSRGSACARSSHRRPTARPPPRSCPAPTCPSTRARSVPQRISSPSDDVRCDRPQASSTIASMRLVLPAALGPHTRCGPGPKATSRVGYPRRSSRRMESSRVSPVRARPVRPPVVA